MAGNSFGQIFKITTFGESHGTMIGVVIDGCPAGLKIDLEHVQSQLDLRKPGQSSLVSARKEEDIVQIVSGVFDGKSTGTPICMLIANKDQRSADYSSIKNLYRPGHADYAYEQKYGIRDYRGGGRSSARETAARVAAGAIAMLILKQYNTTIDGFVSQIGNIKTKEYWHYDLQNSTKNLVNCPDETLAAEMIKAIEDAKANGNSLGGIITCVIKNCPVGLGEPVFDRLEADLAKAMLSINATKGFEIGSGFSAAAMLGSDHNDIFNVNAGKISTTTNHAGGVLGGISNGDHIYFKTAFKPVSSIAQQQHTIDKDGNKVNMSITGRHDPCVVPRAIPIVNAMAPLVIADHILRHRNSKI